MFLLYAPLIMRSAKLSYMLPRIILFRAAILCCLLGCIEVTIPADDAGATDSSLNGTDGEPTVPPEIIGAMDGGSSVLNPTDASSPIAEDIELPPTCSSHCDCPQGWDCTNERCISGTLPIYCCTSPGCPDNAECWDSIGEKSQCNP